jgi:predicted dehydrogenase
MSDHPVKRVRTGIIGCGKVGHLHAQALGGLAEADFVAVSSRSAGSAESFAARYGVAAYTDVGQMIHEQAVEAVIVCSPHPAHADPAVIAAEHGAHVLVEKPLASSLADCDRMIRAAQRAGVHLGVVSQRRFYPPVQRMRAAVDAGKIGTPLLATVVMLGWRDQAYYESDPWRGTWAGEGGGVMVNQAPHQFDLLLWLMGEAVEVYGAHANINHPYIEVEDSAAALIRFASGGLATLLVSNAQKPGIYGKVHIHGQNGASIGAQVESGAMFIAGMSGVIAPPFNDLWTIPGEETLLEQWRAQDEAHFASIDAPVYYLQRQDEDFLRAVREGRPPLIDGHAGRATVALFSAIYESQRTGHAVRLG